MAYVAPPTHNPGDLITAADWNQYIKANWESLTNLVAYTSAGSALSGWTEYTAARGLFIVALVSGGTNLGTVGTALTNQQNVSHSHTVGGLVSSTSASATDKRIIVNSGGAAFPGGTTGGADTAWSATGTADAGSIGIPYIQMMCIAKS